jgi:NAD(P)-dependent dehydrogenase (short-subunit alcohol dehydrogenase family)
MGAALGKEQITVNCICPGLVPSGLLPEAFTNALQADMITSTSTIVKAIATFLADNSLTGQVAECSGQDVIYRPSYEPENEAARYMLALQDGKVTAKFDFAEMGRHAKAKKEFYDAMEESAT